MEPHRGLSLKLLIFMVCSDFGVTSNSENHINNKPTKVTNHKMSPRAGRKLEEERCRSDQDCVPLVSCDPIFDLLLEVKDENSDSQWRSHFVNVVRDRICGHQQKKICCPTSQKVNK